MRVALGRKGDYAVRAVLDLTGHWGAGRRKARQIAAEMDIPSNYVTQILANLVHHDLLIAVAGPDGGYELAQPPGEVTLLTVVEAAEGPMVLDQCVLRGGSCDWADSCPIHDKWAHVQQAVATELQSVTFAELAAIDGAMVDRSYQPEGDEPVHIEPTERRGVSRRA